MAAVLTAAFLLSCGGSDEPSQSGTHAGAVDSIAANTGYVVFADYVNPQDSLPHLRYRTSGLVSINDRCAVRRVKLNPKMPPAWVNGRPVGFC
jgi:hypothetical protein